MRTRVSVFVLVAVVLAVLSASSIAVERDRLERVFGQSKNKSPAAVAAGDDSKAIAKLIKDISKISLPAS